LIRFIQKYMIACPKKNNLLNDRTAGLVYLPFCLLNGGRAMLSHSGSAIRIVAGTTWDVGVIK
jgi:hypothetical protein